MAARFVTVDRNTPMLLPPDLREWVPEDDMVHFVIELDQQLQEDIKDLLEQAERTDQHDDDGGQSIPKEIARREQLREKMQEARRELEQRAQACAAAERGEYEKKVAERETRTGKRKGPKPKPPKDTPDDHEQINLTDADSRLMRKSKREGYTQSYNAQAVVDADGSQLILSGHVSTCASDANELEPAVRAIPESAGQASAVLADTGYVNTEAFERLEKDGLDLYVSVSRDESQSARHYDYRPKSVTARPLKTVKDPRLLAMQEKLRTEAGRALYALRKQTVEPVFGIIKSVMGFRQFLLRGLEKVSGEWDLMCLAYNVKRLWALRSA